MAVPTSMMSEVLVTHALRTAGVTGSDLKTVVAMCRLPGGVSIAHFLSLVPCVPGMLRAQSSVVVPGAMVPKLSREACYNAVFWGTCGCGAAAWRCTRVCEACIEPVCDKCAALHLRGAMHLARCPVELRGGVFTASPSLDEIKAAVDMPKTSKLRRVAQIGEFSETKINVWRTKLNPFEYVEFTSAHDATFGVLVAVRQPVALQPRAAWMDETVSVARAAFLRTTVYAALPKCVRRTDVTAVEFSAYECDMLVSGILIRVAIAVLFPGVASRAAEYRLGRSSAVQCVIGPLYALTKGETRLVSDALAVMYARHGVLSGDLRVLDAAWFIRAHQTPPPPSAAAPQPQACTPLQCVFARMLELVRPNETVAAAASRDAEVAEHAVELISDGFDGVMSMVPAALLVHLHRSIGKF